MTLYLPLLKKLKQFEWKMFDEKLPDMQIVTGDCLEWMRSSDVSVDMCFLDPPFNQGRDYREHDDSMPQDIYWSWIADTLSEIKAISSDGAAIWFMQREKNTHNVMQCLEKTGWLFRNLVIWKKKASPVFVKKGLSKHYQILAYATNGNPRCFNHVRIDAELPAHYKYPREKGLFLTDIWDDIREMSAGYFAASEQLKKPDGHRFHMQQMPIHLALRTMLISTKPGDTILDPFAGTGTTLIAAQQIGRHSIGIDKDIVNTDKIKERSASIRDADRVSQFYSYYKHTDNLSDIFPCRDYENLMPVITPQSKLF